MLCICSFLMRGGRSRRCAFQGGRCPPLDTPPVPEKPEGIPPSRPHVNLERIDKHTNQPVYETTEKNKKQDEKSAGEA